METIHPKLLLPTLLVEGLTAVAQESARRLARSYHEANRRRVGATLRPGNNTPLWNALVLEMRPLLKRRGAKAVLARMLGLPRQRIHDYVVGRGRMPDAERTLLLMEWLAVRKRPANKP